MVNDVKLTLLMKNRLDLEGVKDGLKEMDKKACLTFAKPIAVISVNISMFENWVW